MTRDCLDRRNSAPTVASPNRCFASKTSASFSDALLRHSRENAEELVRWIDDGAHIYVCGDAKHMAPDVHETLRDALAVHRNIDTEAAEQALKELRQQGRYQRDVY